MAEALDRARLEKLWSEVQLNKTRLDECSGPHDFQPVDAVMTLASRYRCTKCQGHLDRLAHYWYEQGRLHGKSEQHG